MSFLKNVTRLIFISLLALGFTGCSDDEGSSFIIPLPSSADSLLVPAELEYNYELLDMLYYYAHLNNEISDDVRDYYNAPYKGNYGYSACTVDYTDVCYMYSEMKDPFTRYYDPYYTPQIMQQLQSSDIQVGLGIEYTFLEKENAIVIMDVFEKSPAKEAGLAANDTIVTIRGTTPSNIDAAQALMDGREGDVVTLEIKRGNEVLTMKVTLSSFITPTVRVFYQDSIPVIRITEFTSETVSDSGTYGEFLNALKKTDGAKSTIIDLRGNPGGDIDQCQAIAAELLAEGDTLIIDVETVVDSVLQGFRQVYFQKFDTVTYTTTQDGLGKDRYYVFLADSNSASCAERLMSSVTVNKKSPVAGLTTYGKGIGQRVFLTASQGLALITGLQSIDKDGDVFHKVGIVPDFVSGDPDEQMAKALEWAKDGSMVRTAGYGTTSTNHFAKEKAASLQGSPLPKNRRELLKSLGGATYFRK